MVVERKRLSCTIVIYNFTNDQDAFRYWLEELEPKSLTYKCAKVFGNSIQVETLKPEY